MPAFDGDGFLDVPARSPKPRTQGLTHVIDKGLNIREIEGMFDTAGEYTIRCFEYCGLSHHAMVASFRVEG